jgi:hypothetical protein
LLAWAGLRFGSAGSPFDFDNQGDQMSSWKISPKTSPNTF